MPLKAVKKTQLGPGSTHEKAAVGKLPWGWDATGLQVIHRAVR